MGRLTTHVLDTFHGRPANAMVIELWRIEGGLPVHVKTVTTNADGRVDGPLLEGDDLTAGDYELLFHVREYFVLHSGSAGASPFLSHVPVRFTVWDAAQHYHVPLLVTPWAYSTYRGSYARS